MSKKKSTQKNDSGFERKGFEEMVKDITGNAMKKLGRSASMTLTVWLEKDVRFAIGNTTINSMCIFVDSGRFSICVTDADAAKNLIVALSDAVDRLEKSED